MGDSGFKSAVGIRNGTAGVIVEMRLDITADDSAQGSDHVIDLSWRSPANGISDADTVHADLVDGGVD